VGIGCTDPGATLEIDSGGTKAGLLVKGSPSQYAIETDGTNGDVKIGTGLYAYGETVLNEGGSDYDFRVEGVGEANALFVQGSDGNVGIGTSSPDAKLDIRDDSGLYLGAGKDLQITVSSDDIYFKQATQDKDIHFQVNDGGVTRTPLSIDGSANKVGIGTTSPNRKLEVFDDTSAPQMRLSHDSTTYTEFQVSSLHDLHINTSSTGRVILNNLNVGGSLAVKVVDIDDEDSPYDAGDETVILADASSDTITINLPAANTVPGRVYAINRNTSSTIHAITLVPESGSIQGADTVTIPETSVTIVAHSDNVWYKVTRD